MNNIFKYHKTTVLKTTVLKYLVYAFWLSPLLTSNVTAQFSDQWTAPFIEDTQCITWGDYDNDGDLDIFVGVRNWYNRIYRNDGDGVFTSVWTSSETDPTYRIALGDYDNDGLLDMLVGNYNSVSRLYHNNGSDSFSLVWSITPARQTYNVAWGDFDNDGDLDILMGIGSYSNQIYTNNGSGNFNLFTRLPGYWSTTCIAWGDYDNDGDLDILSVNYNNSNFVFRNEEGTNFIKAWASPENEQTTTAAWGDYDNDGALDILVGNVDFSNRVYHNDGGDNFSSVWASPETEPTRSIAWGDYDNDGLLDILVGNYSSTNHVYHNDGGGSFSSAWTGPDTDKTWELAWGDYDNDGDLDILVGNWDENNKIYRNDTEGAYTSSAISTEMEVSYDVDWGDYDSDGDLDILVGNNYKTNHVFRNDGGVYTKVWGTPEKETTREAKWGDYDNDGLLDILVGNYNWTNRVYHNDGGDSFSLVWTAPVKTYTYSIAWGDYNNDGYLDILVGNDAQNLLYQNDGGGIFSLAWTSPEWDETICVRWGDYDNDGDLDILCGNEGEPNRVYRNDGTTNFTSAWTSLDSDWTVEVAWGDFDNDGDLDIISGNQNEKNRLYRNEGGGNFTSVWTSLEAENTRSITCGDYDNDGKLEIIVGNWGVNRIYKNRDGYNYTSAWTCTETYGTVGITCGDYDNDGYLDILTGEYNQTNRIYKNISFNVRQSNMPNNLCYISYISNEGETVANNGQYKFKIVVNDNESDLAKISKIEYSLDNRTWVDTGGEIDNITTSPAGNTYYFTWDSSIISKNLIAGQDVRLRFLTTGYFGNIPANPTKPIKSAGPFLYGSSMYQLSVPIKINGFPQCNITSPVSTTAPYNRVSGDVYIYGYAYDDDFNRYILYYGAGTNPAGWVPFHTNTGKVAPFEEMGVWDTSALTNGIYSLKIVASDLSGKVRDSWTNSANRIKVDVVNVSTQASAINFTYPTNQQENVALNSPIVIRFSDKLNPDTLNPDSVRVYNGDDFLQGYIDGSIVYNNFSQTIIFKPSVNLLSWENYVVIVSPDILNIYGIPMGKEYTFKFRTAVYFPDKIASVYPPPTQPDVGISSDIKVYYSDDTMSGSQFTNGIVIKPIIQTNPVPAYNFNIYSNAKYSATYTNVTTLTDKMLYIVTLAPQILDQGYYTWYFVTEDTVPPIVDFSHTSPKQDDTFVDINEKITIGFNKSMNFNMLTSDYLYLQKGTGKMKCKITYSEADKEAYLTPLSPLEEFTLYTIFISSQLRDFGGQELGANYQWSFRTAVLVDRNGGKVSTADSRLKLTIPPHTLDNKTTVQIKKMEGSDIPAISDATLEIVSNAVYQLGPVGTRLKKPVTIIISYSQIDIAGKHESKLAIFINKNGIWKRIGGTIDPDNNTITAVIEEFVIVAVMEDKNSYTGELEAVEIECQPRVFKPGQWEKTALSFKLNKPLKFSVRVCDISGNFVKEIAKEIEGQPGQNVVFWDGKDERGNIVHDRLYVIYIKFDDGDKKITRTKTVSILKK